MCSIIILLVSSAVFSPLSSIFKNIFSGIISITSFSVGMDNPPTNFIFLIESKEICSINAFEFDNRVKNGS